MNLLLLATAAFILLTVLLGKALNIRSQANVTNLLLVLFLFGEWYIYGSYAFGLIPGIATVIGVVVCGLICVIVGSSLPE